MKKVYEQPQVDFESFELSASIAAGCTVSAGFSEGTCGFDIGGATIFTGEVAACNYQLDDGTYDFLCYHVPNDLRSLFGS